MQTKCLAFFAALLCCVGLCACGDGDITTPTPGKLPKRGKITSEELQFTTPTKGDVTATFSTSLGDISVVLYPEIAPQACDNFTTLANKGFFDETDFDRIINGFCVQGGLDAEGNASTIWDNSPYPIEVSDALHHYAGALCTATNESGMASSPFYFVQSAPAQLSDEMITAMQTANYRPEVIDAYTAAGGAPELDYTDTVFGQIYSGIEVLDQIAVNAANAADAETDTDDTETEAIILHSVTIGSYQE